MQNRYLGLATKIKRRVVQEVGMQLLDSQHLAVAGCQ